jgi:hypothetical protein
MSAYQAVVTAPTPEAATALGEILKAEIDFMRSPIVQAPVLTDDGQWSVTVTYWGLD